MESPATLANWEKKPTAHLQSLRPKQAAELFGIGVATFWRWTKRPDFPHGIHLSPRCTVFPVDKLIAWRDAQATTEAVQ